jgi:XTP/dITP diphosphohydrolase
LAPVRILFATSNPHKLAEVQAILGAIDIEVVGLDTLTEPVPEPVEDGDTFAENAELKAGGYARATKMRCLAEDSGLEGDGLGGSPGVYSARYAGAGGTREERDRANNEKLLADLVNVGPDRRQARFVCAMCVAEPNGTIVAASCGTYEGVIALEPRGTSGFGYDPLLFLADVGKTSAELTPEEKNARSHRGAAARALVEQLRIG